VRATGRLRGAASGISFVSPLFQIFTLRGGKIMTWRDFLDRADALEAAGLSE